MSTTVGPVRFEHHRDALGVGEPEPRLSWIVSEAPSGWRAESAAVECRTADGTVERVVLPDPGSVLRPWPFAPLASRERREVRVEVCGADGAAVAGPWTPVEAGLLEASDWTAEVVGPAEGTAAAQARAPLVRGSVELPDGEIARARLYFTGHGLVEPWLNGARVGEQELAPGWTAYEHRLRYSTVDATDLVAVGTNVIGVWIGDGWWRGRLGWDGRRDVYGAELGALAQLEVDYRDGRRVVIGSGPGWRAAPSAIERADLYDGETFDARRHDPAWSTTAFDVAGWDPVAVRSRDRGSLVAPDGPPVRHVESLPVREVLRSPSGAVLLDFGQNLVGRLRITVSGNAGDEVVLRHAEVLEDGELGTRPLRSAEATDRYVLRGGGPETWAPRFTFHGFRYAEVRGWPGELDPGAVVAEVLHSDMERTGTFEASDPRVERLHENVVWGMRGNFVDLPTDCPQRDERLGWTGDIQVFSPTASFLYDSAGFLSSWLRDLEVEQRRLGTVPMVVPAVTVGAGTPTAAWSDAATLVPWTLWERFGDLGVLRRQYSSMTAWVDQVAGLAGESRLWDTGYQFGDWLDPTAPPEQPDRAQTSPDIVATAYFARSARVVADSAALLGLDEDAVRYRALAEEVRTAFRREYVSASGRLLSDSATAYALALRFDLLDDRQRQHAADRLAALVRDRRFTIPTGFVGTPLICDALSAEGHADTAYRLLLQTEAPSWLYAVEHGATTIWERWDSLLPDGSLNPGGMTSFNHYALGSVADWLHRVVAGLAPAQPGFRRIRVAPQPPRRGLTSAGAALQTPYGRAAADWSVSGGELTLRVRVPVGAVADVHLPSGATRLGLEHGEHRFSEPFVQDGDDAHPVTVDTTLGELAERPEALDLLIAVIAKHLPEAADQMAGGLRGQEGLTPRVIAGMLPGAEAVLADLERAFAALSAGDPVPDEVVAPAGRAEDDGLVEQVALLSGQDFWSTRAGVGIRSLVLTDGPHGVRRQPEGADHLGISGSLPATCFPTGAALGSSWDPDLLLEVGAALGREARALGVDVLLGPGVNIKRSPLGGRNFEYLSEDPRLTGALAVGWVRGLQSTGVGASVKHFAANNQETDRMRVDAVVEERALREIYLPAFERVITEAAPATVMSAYNAVNGAFASENRWLLTELLREEWGYEGLVVSDWGAIKDRVEALSAGLDLEMPGPAEESVRAVVAAVRDGRLPREVVETSVARLRNLSETTQPTAPVAVDLDAHHALARRAGAESVVLLRNESCVLPLTSDTRVAVLGSLAERPQFQGGGSSRVVPTRVDTPLTALREQLGEVLYAPGYPDSGPGDASTLLEEATAVAASVEVAVVFVGLDESEQSEGFDRDDLDLPAAQVELIRAAAAAAPRTVVVLSNGGVVTLEPWHDEVDAIVEGWALGQAVGGALADVLTGRVNPSGRLAETIPLRLADTPSFLSFPGEHERAVYAEGVFVGYRYYASIERAVRYPFGHGLSFTSFEYGVPDTEVTGPDEATVRVTVRNTGDRAGAEVVQLYVAPAPSDVRRPVRELGAFAKIRLEPGETAHVELALERRAFAHWDVARHRWRVQPGAYGLELARSAEDVIARVDVELAGDVDRPEPLTLASTVQQWFDHAVVGPALLEGMLQGASEEQRAGMEANLDALRMVGSMPMAQFARMPMVGIPDEALHRLIGLSEAAAAGEVPAHG